MTYNGDNNFTVRIDNVSDTGSFASPLAPGVAAVGTQTAPFFTNQFPDRNLGLADLAEDGNPAVLAGNLQ